jgi:Transposase DDE domain
MANSIGEENWRILCNLLPPTWEQQARLTGAVARSRGFASPEALLRTVLLHVARGYSLRETVIQAKATGLAAVSDVALLKGVRRSGEWLRELCCGLLHENQLVLPRAPVGCRARAVDATLVKEPGPTGSQWRLHYSLQLPSMICDFLEITPAQGEGQGESFRRFPLSAQDLVLGDAGYCTPAGIEYVSQSGAQVLVRVNPHNLPLLGPRGQRWELLFRLRRLQAGGARQWKVRVRGLESAVPGRICALRKSEEAIRKAQRRLQRRASRNGVRLPAESLEYAQYVIVFTTLPSAKGTARQVLEWYRVRWQIELVFKRFKSLLQLGHLPKYDESSSRAWLYGKLLVALLAQKLARLSTLSPWGYWLPGEAIPQRMA